MYKWLQLKTISDLDSLAAELSVEFGPKRIIEKLKTGLSDAVKGILIEKNYIDKDYRSTYYNFYAKKGQAYRPDCIRLHFFDETVTFDPQALKLYSKHDLEERYFGYMVLRPTGIGTIGRSVVSPDVRKSSSASIITANQRIITAKHKVHLLGYKLTVEGFPSMDQHIDISVCAHAACWSILRHYSERYTLYREFFTHDITLMAQQFDPGGLVPSKGLQMSHAERVFQEAGTFPFHVVKTSVQDAAFYRQLHAYVESGFPLFAADHTVGHAMAVVGYEWEPSAPNPIATMRYAWDGVKSIIVVDDNYLPYQVIEKQGATPYPAGNIDAFIVALPEKIFYPADAVDRLAPTLFKLAPMLGGLPAQNEVTLRYFITTGSALRRFVRTRESEFDPKLIETIMTLPFAQFVWIVEIATGEDWAKGQISARAVLDATASLREVMPFWLFHNRKTALLFDRSKVNAGIQGIRELSLSGMQSTALTRWDQNLRPTRKK